jgi:hypothetical protein
MAPVAMATGDFFRFESGLTDRVMLWRIFVNFSQIHFQRGLAAKNHNETCEDLSRSVFGQRLAEGQGEPGLPWRVVERFAKLS